MHTRLPDSTLTMKRTDKLQHKLEETQREHNKILKKIEKARAKLEARGQELRVVEAKLAELESELHAAHAPGMTGDSLPSQRTARLIYNPNAGDARDQHPLPDVVEHLRKHGIRAQVTVKTTGKSVRDSAAEAAKRGEALVIVAGGDGTIEKAASQLVGSETALGILPFGSMNNLARCLGIPLDLDDACALIAMGTARNIDVGRVNVNAKSHVKYFLETAGLGLNAILFPMGHKLKKGILGDIPATLKKIVDSKATAVTVELDDGQVIQANAQVITVSNAPMTGMNFLISPEAKMDDGWLDIAIYDDMGKADLLAYFLASRNGHRAAHPKIKTYRSRRVHIQSQDPNPIVSDKDPLPERKALDIEILSQALRVIVGKGIGLTFPVDVAPSVPPLSGPQQVNGHSQAGSTSNGDEQAESDPKTSVQEPEG